MMIEKEKFTNKRVFFALKLFVFEIRCTIFSFGGHSASRSTKYTLTYASCFSHVNFTDIRNWHVVELSWTIFIIIAPDALRLNRMINFEKGKKKYCNEVKCLCYIQEWITEKEMIPELEKNQVCLSRWCYSSPP